MAEIIPILEELANKAKLSSSFKGLKKMVSSNFLFQSVFVSHIFLWKNILSKCPNYWPKIPFKISS